MGARLDKSREYFAKLLGTPEEAVDYSEIPPATAVDRNDAEILLRVTAEGSKRSGNLLGDVSRRP